MLEQIYYQLSQTIVHLNYVMTGLTALVHLLFAAGVAKDIGNMTKRNLFPQLVPGYVWVLASLLSGVWAVLIYWLMHHSSLAR
jgi:phage shock protein PspC (stress-responsive transcriptional regulator)